MTRWIDDCTLELRKDTEALRLLGELVELEKVPPERGGSHFSDWERGFIKNTHALFAEQGQIAFSQVQRDKIKEIWQAADLRKRARPDEQAKNLFSALSPERQAEQRARAAKVRLPWEK